MLLRHASKSTRSTMRGLFAALCVSLLWATPSSALTLIYQGLFTPEGGPGATGGGSATVTIDTDASTMRVEASFSGLSSTTQIAHIHCCTLSPGTGNAGVASQVPSFSGFPTGVTAGSYDATFDMTLATSFNPAFVTANGGTLLTAFDALLVGLDDDRAYFNIHTVDFPAGEIRARLALIPEPGTALLVLTGLGLLGTRRRRRLAADGSGR